MAKPKTEINPTPVETAVMFVAGVVAAIKGTPNSEREQYVARRERVKALFATGIFPLKFFAVWSVQAFSAYWKGLTVNFPNGQSAQRTIVDGKTIDSALLRCEVCGGYHGEPSSKDIDADTGELKPNVKLVGQNTLWLDSKGKLHAFSEHCARYWIIRNARRMNLAVDLDSEAPIRLPADHVLRKALTCPLSELDKLYKGKSPDNRPLSS